MRPTPETQVVFASTARTATHNSSTFANQIGHRGIELIIDCTASADTPSVVFTLQGYSPTGDDYYTILASAAVTAAATTILRAFPGATAANNTVANFQLPALWRVLATHADADSITYSVTAILLP
jgi:hypothetical protein